MAISTDSSIVGGYPLQAGVYDEMIGQDAEVRPHWRYLMQSLGSLGTSVLRERAQEAHRLLGESGVTYNVYGDPQGPERSWELDPLPLLVSSEEWLEIEVGLVQRAELFNLILQDIYGPQELVKSGLLPFDLIYGHGGFLRPCHPLRTRTVHPLVLYAADLARAPDGKMWVIADRTQAPSGAGYALENRVVMTRILPSLFRDSHVHRLSLFFQNLRASLAALSPRQETEPRIVVLTPGPLNETYFEHSYLASYLGYTLAQGNDLTVRDGRVWLRSMRRLEPVDVIVRRVDDHFCDPVELRPDSRLGVPGLAEVVRRGNVAVANPLGSSVLENPALNAFLPAISEHFLGRELELPSVATWWCGQPKELDFVLANLAKLVIKPIYRQAGAQSIFGTLLTRQERKELEARIRMRPHLYVGQEQVSFSSAPALVDSGLEPRQAVLRTFLAARDDGYVVMPGGLTRIAPTRDTFIVSNQAGGISKDTWILATEPEKQVSLLPTFGPRIRVREMSTMLPPAAADGLFWLGRYAERAEQGIRLMRSVVRVHQQVFEFRAPTERATLEALLQAMTHQTGSYPGFVGPGAEELRAQPLPELLSLVSDSARTGTISYNLHALLKAAYAVRDQISNDFWRVINSIRGKLERLPKPPSLGLIQLQDHLDELTTLLMGLAGLAQESMIRSQAWLFLDMGRRLERAQLLSTLLRVTLVAPSEPQVETQLLDALLRSSESLLAYRRGYHEQPQLEPALVLLLKDEANPRSLAYQLTELQTRVEALPREGDKLSLTDEQRLILEGSTALRLVELEELVAVDEDTGTRAELDRLLTQVTDLLAQSSDALTRDYFTDVRGPQQLMPSGQGGGR